MNTEQDQRPLTFAQKIEKSSQVCHVSYDAEARELHVIFRTNAALYAYLDYPPDMWIAIQKAPSIGSFLIHNVTRPLDGKLPYQFQKRALPESFVIPPVHPKSTKP